MSIFLIIGLAVAIGIYWMSKSSKSKRIISTTTAKRPEIPHGFNFPSEFAKFPDRTDAILFHKQCILNAVAAGNLELANLSFAKLIESVRQQNSNLGGAMVSDLALLRNLYEAFRKEYHLEYPPQFLPLRPSKTAQDVKDKQENIRSKNGTVATNSAVQKTGRMVSIPSLDFFGPYSESPNGRFIIAWSDSDPSRHVGGYRDKGHGSYVLVNGDRVVCSGKLERPNDGKAADDGTFILADWLFGDGLKSIIYAFSVSGNAILRHRFTANMANTGLSPSGHYAVAQLANSDSEDGGCLAFFDLVERKMLWKQRPASGWANSYRFNDETKRLGLVYRERGVYEYAYDGTFADSEQWDKDRIKFASSFELVWIAQEKLKQIPVGELTPVDADYLLQILTLALTKDLDQYPNEHANAYRTMGEIYEAMGNRSLAIEKYEVAIGINPKVGVKRRLKKLKEHEQ